MLNGEKVAAHGEVVTANTMGPLEIPGATAPPVLVAALGPIMLKLAGRMASGTITWMTGIETVRSHVAPGITEAAREAARPPPMVGVSLPVVVTDDVEGATQKIDQVFGFYPNLPSYRAMMDREGVERPSEIALVGSEEAVLADLERLEQAGATDFIAAVVGDRDVRDRTLTLLGQHTSS
jgi:alkanesulfonate monooxygenase SsuD/methylene tetrahydromethanopterin reductase-like flavin-dependent oxidoreductase (luciferase family)